MFSLALCPEPKDVINRIRGSSSFDYDEDASDFFFFNRGNACPYFGSQIEMLTVRSVWHMLPTDGSLHGTSHRVLPPSVSTPPPSRGSLVFLWVHSDRWSARCPQATPCPEFHIPPVCFLFWLFCDSGIFVSLSRNQNSKEKNVGAAHPSSSCAGPCESVALSPPPGSAAPLQVLWVLMVSFLQAYPDWGPCRLLATYKCIGLAEFLRLALNL